jgi:uncharacterized surface protein with fasciclin (FAS1) repeats
MLAVAVGILPFWRVSLSAELADASEYTVKRGETLRAIAHDQRVEVGQLAEVNTLATNATLYRQQKLTLPVSAQPAARMAPVVVAQAAPAADGTTYTVKKGDSLRSIAKKLGVELDALAQANGLQPNSTLYRQQVLVVPTGDMAPSDAPAAPEAPAADATPAPMQEPAAEATATPEPEAEAPANAGTDIVHTAMAAGNFTFLIAALDAAGLTETLRGAGPFTVFAPVDGAFADLPADQLQALLDDPTGDLTQILLYHVVPGSVLAGEISNGSSVVTVQGGELTFTVEGSQVKVNDANILMTDIFAANGVIHVIDAVLIPPSDMAEEAMPEATAEPTEEAMPEATVEPTEEAMPEATAEPTEEAMPEATAEPTAEPVAELADIVDTAVAAGDFTTLVAAVEAAGLVDALKGEGPYTVFAPTDAAFAALPDGALDALLADPGGDLTQILLYHVVPGKVMAADLRDGLTAATLQGEGEESTLTFNIGPDGATVNGIKISVTDIETSNGVIHVIDGVILPLGGQANGPNAPLAPAANEAASPDAASLIILPMPQIDLDTAAELWPLPAGNLALFSPVESGGYHSPLVINGLARSAEGFVAIDLVDAQGQVLAQRAAQGGMTDFAFFQTSLRFSVFEVTEATLRIVEMDMADGSILTEVSVPLTLIPGQRVIDVTSPVVGQLACGQVLVGGYSNTFEANVVLTLQTPLGAQLEQLPAMGGTLGVYRDFVTPLAYTGDETAPLLVSLEEQDASGRFPAIDKTVVPFVFVPADDPACQ